MQHVATSPPRKTAELGSVSSTLVPWLAALRWAVIVSLGLALVASAWWLGLTVRWTLALPTLAGLVVMNLLWRLPRFSARLSETPAVIGWAVLCDMIAIALVLAASGGAANPFSALLFVYVALAASLLPARITYLLGGVAALTFGALFLAPSEPAACAACEARDKSAAFSNHLYGMWVAFAVGAGLVVVFLTRVRQALEERDRALEAMKRRADEDAKFIALGTLAGGAAHELGTPLGTIAVLAGELGRATEGATRDSARQIGEQIDRCRAVIRRMQPGARGERGSAPLVESVERAVDAWRAAHPAAEVELRAHDDARVPLGPADIEAAVSVLLDNALHATHGARSTAPITIDAGLSRRGPFVSVSDAGTGIPADIAHRMGEPFLTSKEPGEGMGLGLYLVRKMLTDVGGRLEIEARAAGGTRVSLHLDPPSGAP